MRVALEALADEPVRVLATTNRHAPEEPLPDAPANAVVVDWLSYSQAMAAADLVICHGGHGTVARALAAGVPVICCPAVGRHGRERGAGCVGRRGADAAVAADAARRRCGRRSEAAARAANSRARAGEIAAWAQANQGAARGAELLEQLALEKGKSPQTQAF